MEGIRGGHIEHGLLMGLASSGGGELLSSYGGSLSYNTRGWQTSSESDSFSEYMAYGSGSMPSPKHPRYNGNISAVAWKWKGVEPSGYNFTYDDNDRLVSASYGEGTSLGSNAGRYDTHYQYDVMGNVEAVTRKGKLDDGSFALIDDISMDYEGNRLVKADDAVDGPYYAGAFHFVDRADEEEEYSYDANGNMTSDLNKNIARIDYNCLNLPTMIRFGDGSKYMSMKYDAAGRLLRRTTRVPFKDIAVGGKLQLEYVRADLTTLRSGIVARNGAAASATSTAGSSSGSSAASPSLAPSTTLQGTPSSVSSSVVPAISGKVSMRTFGMTDYDYCGNVEYTNDKAVLYHSEGYVTFDKNQQPEFHYYLKDHLGNVRVVFNERDSVEQVTHYYPFGGSFGDGVGSSVQDYLYSGKELTRFNALNWYNYGARWYDPATLRWNGVDKLAEKYTPVSPYVYCLNSPVNAVDPDGRSTWVVNSGNGEYKVVGGNLSDNDRSIYVGTFNDKNEFVPQGTIGTTTSLTSFYDSDLNGGKGAWVVGSTIDLSDKSGVEFLNRIVGLDVTLDDYMDKARNNHPYDFKVTNGGYKVVSTSEIYKYRGMSIGKDGSGKPLITSARDIGNMSAGIVAAKNGIPWSAARIAFDAYQSRSGLRAEGLSTRNAEYYGWSKMYSRSNTITESNNVKRTIKSVLRRIINWIF